MASNTPNLNLLKKNPTTDGDDTFNIETMLNANWDKIDADKKAQDDALIAHLADYTLQVPYGIATGSANVKGVNLTPPLTVYVEGVALSFKNNLTNTLATTISVNGLGSKSIIDSKGNTLTAGKLIAGSIYTLRYDGTNFILQGEGGSGNALASDLLTGKTASTDAGDIVGTMPSRTGNVAGQGVSRSGTTVRIQPQEGYYNGVSGNSVQFAEPNLIASNIVSGVSIFGLNGSFNGKKWASGTTVSSSSMAYYVDAYGNDSYTNNVTVSGLTFQPTLVLMYWNNQYVSASADTTRPLFNGYNIVYNGSKTFRLTSPAYINQTGFRLPFGGTSVSVYWIAFE